MFTRFIWLRTWRTLHAKGKQDCCRILGLWLCSHLHFGHVCTGLLLYVPMDLKCIVPCVNHHVVGPLNIWNLHFGLLQCKNVGCYVQYVEIWWGRYSQWLQSHFPLCISCATLKSSSELFQLFQTLIVVDITFVTVLISYWLPCADVAKDLFKILITIKHIYRL